MNQLLIPIKDIMPGDVILFSDDLPMLCLSIIFNSESPNYKMILGLLNKKGHLSLWKYSNLNRMVNLYFRVKL